MENITNKDRIIFLKKQQYSSLIQEGITGDIAYFISNFLFSNDRIYDDKSIHVSDLILPPKALHITKKHWIKFRPKKFKELSNLLFGSLFHQMMEQIPTPECIEVEKRITKHIDAFNIDLIATPDKIDHGEKIIRDFKTTTVRHINKIKNDGLMVSSQELALQIAIYRYIIGREDYSAEIVWIPKDYSQLNFKQKNMTIFLKSKLDGIYLDFDMIKNILYKRISIYLDDSLNQDDIQCSDSETWDGKRCEHFCKAYDFCNQSGGSISNKTSGIKQLQ